MGHQHQCGTNRRPDPTADLEPVHITGVTVSRASLHNEDEIPAQGYPRWRYGHSRARWRRHPPGGPVLFDERPLESTAFVMPTHCPVCSTAVYRPAGEAVARCPNAVCPAQIKERLLHYGARRAMDIDGLGTALVQQLVERGLVHDFADLYALDVPTLAKLRRLADKSASNLVAAIDRSRERGFARLLFGLGIRHVGERVAAILAARYGTIDALAQAPADELSQVNDIGPVIAERLPVLRTGAESPYH